MLYRVIIAGSRDFNDIEKLTESCDSIISGFATDDKEAEIVIISGGARGADKLAEKYALAKGYKNEMMPADWNRFGKSAGYIRNASMAQQATRRNGIGCLIAFWDGESKGTKHMIDTANKKKMKVAVVRFR